MADDARDGGRPALDADGNTPASRQQQGPASPVDARELHIASIRTQGDLLVLHVATPERAPDPGWLVQLQRLVGELGGTFRLLEADDPVQAVLGFADQQQVTQILVGESLRPRWQEVLRGSFVTRLIQQASHIDIHVLAQRKR